MIFNWFDIWLQLADAKAVMQAIREVDSVRLPVLVPNLKVSFIVQVWTKYHKVQASLYYMEYSGIWCSNCIWCKGNCSFCISFWIFFQGQHQLQHRRESYPLSRCYYCCKRALNTCSGVLISFYFDYYISIFLNISATRIFFCFL